MGLQTNTLHSYFTIKPPAKQPLGLPDAPNEYTQESPKVIVTHTKGMMPR